MAAQAVPALAFVVPSGQEVIVLLVIGVLLFGRRLPEVGRQIGRVVTNLRRSVDSFKREIAEDEAFRGARSGLREIGRVAEAPKRIADPKRLFDDLTDASRATRAPAPDPSPSPAPDPSPEAPSEASTDA